MDGKIEVGEVVYVSEMAIVDTFTKLIFGVDDVFTESEERIIAALRTVDANVLRDSIAEMGQYLRNLGVREMIQLVARVREHLAESAESFASDSECGRSGVPRRIH